MGIDWSNISNSKLEYFRNRCLPYVEADIAGWHYWAFYSTAPLYNETETMALIEGIFFTRDKVKDINTSFHVPGQWLADSNRTIYQLLLEHIEKGT